MSQDIGVDLMESEIDDGAAMWGEILLLVVLGGVSLSFWSSGWNTGSGFVIEDTCGC